MLQFFLKLSSFLIKTCLKFHKWLQIDHNMIYLKLPLLRGGRPGHTPETEIPNMALEFVRQMQFNSMMKTEFPCENLSQIQPI